MAAKATKSETVVITVRSGYWTRIPDTELEVLHNEGETRDCCRCPDGSVILGSRAMWSIRSAKPE